jgi:hypothetical protein
VAEGEKSLDQLMQLAMTVYYNQDVTKKKENDKRHHDLITALRECPTQACYHCGQDGSKKGTDWETDPVSTGILPPLSAKVTTGGLSALVSR